MTLGPLLLQFKTRFLVWRQAFKPAMSRPRQAPPLPVPGLFCRLCSAALALRGGGQAAARRAHSGRPGPLWKPVHGPGAAARSPTAAPGGWAARPSGSEEPCTDDRVRLRKSSSTGQSSVALAGKASRTLRRVCGRVPCPAVGDRVAWEAAGGREWGRGPGWVGSGRHHEIPQTRALNRSPPHCLPCFADKAWFSSTLLFSACHCAGAQ